MFWSLSLLLIAALPALPGSLLAQEMDAPAEIQIPLLYKILTFDRKLGERAPGEDLVIAIVFQTGYRGSVVARDQVVDALKHMGDSTISGHKVHWLAVELSDVESLKLSLVHNRVDVMYVTPLRGVELNHIVAASRAAGITTFTGVPRYVERGLALGVGIARERPQIIVNLLAARAEGSDFTSQLLRVCKVFEE
jgi:YfiR/HmsC-like